MAETGFSLKDPKIWVWAGLIGPGLYILFRLWEREVMIWIPIGLIVLAGYLFSESFISKSEVRVVKGEQFGPQESYILPGSEHWQMQPYDLNGSGEYVPKKVLQPPIPPISRPPPRYSQYGGETR